MTDTFITKRKLTIFSCLSAFIMTFSTFATPVFQLGSVVNAQDIPDSYTLEEGNDPPQAETPDIQPDLSAPINSLSLTNLEDGEVDILDSPQFKVKYSAEDPIIEGSETSGVSHIKISENSDLSLIEWTDYSGELIVENKEFVNGESNKIFFMQTKDSAGNESEVIQKTISLKQYNILPEIETVSKDMLLGDEGSISINIKNSGSDIAYNTYVKINLPKGFSLIEDVQNKNNIVPTEINNDEEGNQVLIYQSIADLLPGEGLDFEIKLQLPSLADGYEISQIVNIPIETELYAFTNFSIGYRSEDIIQVELKPIRASLENSTNGEVLVGDELENKITVETTPDLPTIQETTSIVDDGTETISKIIEPLAIFFRLDEAENYKEGSQRVFINGEEVSLEEYNILFEEAIDIYNSNPVLKWIFQDKISAETIIEIFFGVEVDKYDSDSIIPDYTEHGDDLQSKLEVKSGFEDSNGEVIEIAEEQIQSIRAKYFTVNKYIQGNKSYNPGDILTYTVDVETSKFYDLSGVTVEDILPDGVNINDQLTISNEQLIISGNLADESVIQNYVDSVVKNENGETIINWNIVEIPAGAKYSFKYDVVLGDTYDFKQLENNELVSSADKFGSSVTITGIWSDVGEDIIRTGSDDNDTDRANFGIDKVTYKNEIKLEDSSDFSNAVDVRTGDIVNVRSEVTFPENAPTNNYQARIYLPVGAELIDSPSIAYSGFFQNSPEDITISSTLGLQENPNYIFLDLGDVQKDSSYIVSYSLLIKDDANLKLATQVRNLFRSTYLNIDGEKVTDRSEVNLTLIEPKIKISKGYYDGYLAAGENFKVKTKIENAGTSKAYGLVIKDSVPNDTSIGINSNFSIVSNFGNTYQAIYDEIARTFTLDNIDLEPGEILTIVYQLETGDSVVYNDSLNSNVSVSEYSNRSIDDPKPARFFEESVYNFSWKGREALLSTSISAYELNQTEFGKYEIGREFEFSVDTNTEVVGRAPVYNSKVSSSFSTSPLGEGWGEGYDLNIIDFRLLLNNEELVINNEKVTIHGGDADVSYDSDTGDVSISGIEKLYPGDVITVKYELKTDTYIPFELIYEADVSALASNAIDLAIRKDGSYQTGRDYDDDDYSNVSFVTAKIDNDAPTGDISFILNNEYVYSTNKDSVDEIQYRAFDQSKVVGMRFSDEGSNWYTLPEGADYNLRLQEDLVQLLQLEGEWNLWSDGSNVLHTTHNTQLSSEGKNYRYMQLVDLYGNITTIENYIIKDTVAPSIADVVISPFEGDLSDPIFTGTSENYIHFFSVDDNHLSDGSETDEYSGVGWYRFAAEINQLDEAEWNYMLPGVNTFEFDWDPLAAGQDPLSIEDGDTLTIYMQIKDLAGNLYEGNSPTAKECSSIEVLNLVQDTGHLICDDITFTTDIPEVSIDLNNGDVYTKNAVVNLGLEVLESTSGVQSIKFNDGEWIPYTDSITEYVLPESWNTGDKELCVQVEDAARARSNIACDSIVFDPIAPEGYISTRGLNPLSNDVTLELEALDPILDDGNDGIGNIQMRFSETGRNCQLIEDEEEASCDSQWTDWEDLQSARVWELRETGQNYVYVQFKDGIENTSDIYSATVIYNSFAGEGDILINNDEVFTNEELVNLDLSLSCTSLLAGVEGFCDQSPVLMRLVTTSNDSTAELPPIWNTREEYELWYENNDGGLPTVVASGEGWSYWTEYQSSMQWHLLGGNNKILTGSNDPESPYSDEFGKKNVYVQYLFADGSVSELHKDSIVYAPFYGVEYSPVEADRDLPLPNNIYTINTVPESLYSQDSITIKLNAKNIGSLTWSPYAIASEDKPPINPVKLSYRWKSITSIGEGAIPTEYRGNSAILPENISWNEETGELELIVDTPLFPGDYELVIDTIHEGVTWFSDFGNDVLSYQISIDQNPDEEPQPLGSSIPEEEGAIGAGSVCYVGNTNSFRGIYKTAPINQNGPYYIDVNGNGADSSDTYFYGFTQFLGQEVIADVVYSGVGCRFASINMYAAPKTWRSTWDSNVGSNSIYNNTIHIQRGESININLVFRNDGTGVWERNNVFMYASSTGSQTLTTNFDRSNFRIEMYTGYSSVGQSGGGLFQAHIEIPSDKSVGLYSLCYRLIDNKGYSWEKNDTKCISVQVELNSADEQELRCAEPHNVYKSADVNSTVIAVLNQNDSIVVVEELIIEGTPWMRVAHPNNPTADAWINNSDDCFDFITTIDNPIQAPDIPEPKTPTGDTGVIIAIDGLDVRHGPSPLFPIKDTIPYDSEARVIGQITLPFGYGHWLKIEYVDDNGVTQEGWVSDGFVAHVNNPPVIQFNITPPYVQSHTCSSVDARSLPGNQFPVVKSLSGNFNTNIIARWDAGQLGGSGVWYQIYLDSTGRSVGWVPESAMCRGYWSPPPAANGSVNGVSGTFYNGVAYSSPLAHTSQSKGGALFGVNRGDYIHDGLDLSTLFSINDWDTKTCRTFKLFGKGDPIAVYASADGVVKHKLTDKQGGIFIDIVHANGTMTRYLHLAPDNVGVRAGDKVKRGQFIANLGLTGNTSGCHLHFEIWKDTNGGDAMSNKLNPIDILNGNKNEVVTRFDDGFRDLVVDYTIYGNEKDLYKTWQCGFGISREFEKGKLKDGTDVWQGMAIYSTKGNRPYIIKNSVLSEYKVVGGPCGILGYPTGSYGFINGKRYSNHYSEVEALPSRPWQTTGWYQQFENGQIYFNRRTNDSYHVYGSIYKVYSQLEGTWGSFGFPKSDPYQQSGQLCQDFEGGKICESDVEDLLIHDKVNKLGGGSKDGVVHDWCGTRVLDFHNIAGHGDSIIMVNPNDGKAYLITGGIWETYVNRGGCSLFGYPHMDEQATGRVEGWWQEFDKGDIYWSKNSKKSQPGVVIGSIRDRFRSMSGTWSYLGFPEGYQTYASSNVCGVRTEGYHQGFSSGKIYTTSKGTVDWKYGNYMDKYWQNGEVNSALGWPVGNKSYENSFNEVRLEGGKIYKEWYGPLNALNRVSVETQKCEVIHDDFKLGAPQNIINLFKNKEQATFSDFERADGDNGILHPYCGGWVIDYTDVTYSRNGNKAGKTWLMTNGSNSSVHILEGEVANYFWKNGDCSRFGFPSEDKVDQGGSGYWWGGWQGFGFKQQFSKGAIYNYEKPYGIRLSSKFTFHVEEPILSKYTSSYGVPANNQYNYTENGVTTLCQDFRNGRVCEDTIPEKTAEQKAFEKYLDREVLLSEIKTTCGKNSMEISGAKVLYVDGSIIELKGNIYQYWTSNNGCNSYGFPTTESFGLKKDDITGAFQDFSKGYSLVTSTYGTMVLEGGYKDAYDFINMGYPKPGIKTVGPVCTEGNLKTGSYLDVQNGRLYEVNGSYYHIQGDSNIGSYFFTKGGHDKFGLPTENAKWNIVGTKQTQKFELTTLYHWRGGNTGSETPLEGIFCEEDAPVCGNDQVEYGETCDGGAQCSLTCDVQCSGDETWNDGRCQVPEEPAPTCGEDEILENNVCVARCGDGEVWDNNQCRDQCGNGETWDQSTQSCRTKLACEDSPYKLPWPGGKSYYVTQDILNDVSHNSYGTKYALDFSLQVGDPIVASRDGVVLDSEQRFEDYVEVGGSEFASMANWILIEHDDGTRTIYVHIQQDSVSLNNGDRVNQGDLIANSGFNGWNDGPHLHYTARTADNESVYREFSDTSVCNDRYNGTPKWNFPEDDNVLPESNRRRESFKSDNY